MGFLSDIVGSISGGDIIDAGTAIAGAVIGNDANQRGAEAAVNANNRAADISSQAATDSRKAYNKQAKKGIRAIDAGVQDYEDYVRPILIESQPGMLNPVQSEMREELLRDATRAQAGAGLRGAGRSGVALINDLDRGIKADAYDTNLARSDRTRQLLGGIHADRGTQVANIRTGIGANDANAIHAAGGTSARLAANSGQELGNAATAQGEIANRTIGRLASIIADENKSRDAYPETKTSRV